MINEYFNFFKQKGYVFIPNLIDDHSIKMVSKYFENCLKQNLWKLKSNDNDKDLISSYSRYADPLVEIILENCVEDVKTVTGKSVVPTYSYSRIYLKGDELKRHTDRPSCEYSVTVNVASVGEKLSPVWVKAFNGESRKYNLQPGDAIIYKGCEIEHWRDPLTDTDINVQFMLHYVDLNGPYAEYKWDKRESLALPSSERK
jgi:hypothetical protein